MDLGFASFHTAIFLFIVILAARRESWFVALPGIVPLGFAFVYWGKVFYG